MKLIVFFIVISFSLTAQINQITISNLDLIYKEELTIGLDTLPKVYIQSTISLKDSSDVTFINFEIIDKTDSSSKYQVSYNVNNTEVISQDGQLLFKKETNTIFLNTPSVFLLKPYLYQISTKNSNGVLSELFSEFK